METTIYVNGKVYNTNPIRSTNYEEAAAVIKSEIEHIKQMTPYAEIKIETKGIL